MAESDRDDLALVNDRSNELNGITNGLDAKCLLLIHVDIKLLLESSNQLDTFHRARSKILDEPSFGGHSGNVGLEYFSDDFLHAFGSIGHEIQFL